MFVIAGKYHVLTTLGRGGMGAVYEAIHTGTGRRVAVKMLRAEIASNERARERFVREARLVGALSSPHVAEIFDAGTDEASGLPYIVMELLDGTNLRDVLRNRRRLPVGLVLVVAAHVAAGLREAHEAGVIHRDVKPANVVLGTTRDGELVAKLVDFGVAKALEDDDVAGLTRTGDFVGSLPYMSPEQLSGRPATERSDLWSLGAIMYEALAGVRPSGSDDALAEIVRNVCDKDVTPLAKAAPWVPAPVADVVHRALERDPAKRFETARAMESAIVAFLPGGTQVAATALEDGADIRVVLPAERRVSVRRTTPIVAAALVAVAATTGVLWVRGLRAPAAAVEPAAPPPLAATPEPSASVSEVADLDEPSTSSASSASPPAAAPRARSRASAAPAPRAKIGAPKREDPLDHM